MHARNQRCCPGATKKGPASFSAMSSGVSEACVCARLVVTTNVNPNVDVVVIIHERNGCCVRLKGEAAAKSRCLLVKVEETS